MDIRESLYLNPVLPIMAQSKIGTVCQNFKVFSLFTSFIEQCFKYGNNDEKKNYFDIKQVFRW